MQKNSFLRGCAAFRLSLADRFDESWLLEEPTKEWMDHRLNCSSCEAEFALAVRAEAGMGLLFEMGVPDRVPQIDRHMRRRMRELVPNPLRVVADPRDPAPRRWSLDDSFDPTAPVTFEEEEEPVPLAVTELIARKAS